MKLTIEKTHDTPYVNLDNGLIEIKGRSMPENVLIFFEPIFKWIKKYVEKPAEFTKIDLFLSYTNSCSIKHISDMLRILNTKYKEGFNMKIFWTYEQNDEEAKEAGHELESLLNIPFEYIETETESKNVKRILVKNLLTGKIGEISQRYWDTIVGNGHDKDFELLEK
ncbi:MAG: hypothetical protein A2X13_05875 [Bacteroidetes bacterium GWC2_33_15]|nr:MAG: hypothetical protein A2X10_00560 [Bacteroidetes bacterium GWA2_33_15]OFX52017.1 MAG: hypothetical protein A2X13_05875 [Bacteroidetes bacterium GWC2_33_15]OFX63847.1 MAG: hypothetical protein A2X15_00800 [Bacteroidetes bacterium GWB2_32_14]OFX67420.1 MAG: hypothetical protein A2X14_12605 [Bacteroidetes bacterium GWD2_33_33]HAN17814.1 nuclear pore complex subunit [Bacteroidales bacterium]